MNDHAYSPRRRKEAAVQSPPDNRLAEPTPDEEKGFRTNRRFYLPRLAPEAYRSHAVVHWTLTLDNRATGWLTKEFHAHFRELMLHAAAREMLHCPTYCLMPDHLHLIWMALSKGSDQRPAMAFLRTHLHRVLHPLRFQHQAHDHVLRIEERKKLEFENMCLYVLENPVRAGLTDDVRKWEYTGAVVSGYPNFHPLKSDFWNAFWKVYWMQRGEAGK